MNLHEDVIELLGAYTLGALEEAEAALVQAHVRECEVCQKELAGFAEVTTHLAHLGPVQPPPELRGRILAAVRQEANAQNTPPQQSPRRINPLWLWAAVLVALLISQAWLLREVFSLRTTIEQQRQIQAVLLSSEHAPIEMKSPDPDSATHGYYRAETELHMGLLNYYHLPPPNPTQSYQCWFEFADGQAVSCGVLPVDEGGHGFLLVTIPEPLPDTIRVTVEEGNESAPTGSTLLVGHLNWD
jgi:hypothetical protein